MADIKLFQEKIGYTFSNEALLRQALTHSSYANEKRMKKLSLSLFIFSFVFFIIFHN